MDESTTSQLQNSEYIFKKFIGHMIDDVTLEVIARNLDINNKTALYYRFLVFESLRNYQEEIILEGTVSLMKRSLELTRRNISLKGPMAKALEVYHLIICAL